MSHPHDSRKHVVIIGAGPGGLTAGMLLAHQGLRVSIYEKAGQVGGRNAELTVGPYRFDLGPTFLMMKFILDEVFAATDRRSADYLRFLHLDPMYVLQFDGLAIRSTTDRTRMRQQIAELFPGQEKGLDRLFDFERKRFVRMYPCLQKDYGSPTSMVSLPLLRAMPWLSLTKTMHDALSGYFSDERLRLAFTFQSKYLGMSPWTCPAAFMIIPYVEYAAGVYHVMGGLNRISHAMAKVIAEDGGTIHLNTPVKQVCTRGRTVTGVELADGTRVAADAVVINADFAQAMNTLFAPGALRKYTPDHLAKREYSCSTFMLYLGLDKVYPLEHHTILFARDYKRFVGDIFNGKTLPNDLSFYIRNASINDPHIAPPGHSAVYVLVPVPNQSGPINWERETQPFTELVLDAMERRAGMTDLRRHIVAQRIITPQHWQASDIYHGATFNLAHTLGQMLYFRPHNAFEELKRCYLVGGGTHPGSGLPTIYESGRISARLLCQDLGVTPPPAPPAMPQDVLLN